MALAGGVIVAVAIPTVISAVAGGATVGGAGFLASVVVGVVGPAVTATGAAIGAALAAVGSSLVAFKRRLFTWLGF